VSLFASAVLVCLLGHGAGRADELKAEYAIRWDPATGGPKTAQETLDVLGKTAEDTDEYTVQYFDLTPPADAPAGFRAILRQRQKQNAYELTFKYRGEGALATWTCPLSAAPAKQKAEVDVSILADGVKRAHAYSCSVESVGAPVPPPAALKAVPKSCASTTTRIEAGKLKIEEWHPPGGVTLIEVSRNGKPSAEDLERFQDKVAKKLLKRGITPSGRSKTELGGSCPSGT
jgi:hypothetical protein